MNANLHFYYVNHSNVNKFFIVGKKALFLMKINKFTKKLNRKNLIGKFSFILKMDISKRKRYI